MHGLPSTCDHLLVLEQVIKITLQPYLFCLLSILQHGKQAILAPNQSKPNWELYVKHRSQVAKLVEQSRISQQFIAVVGSNPATI